MLVERDFFFFFQTSFFGCSLLLMVGLDGGVNIKCYEVSDKSNVRIYTWSCDFFFEGEYTGAKA